MIFRSSAATLLAVALGAALLFNGEHLHWYAITWSAVIAALALAIFRSGSVTLPCDPLSVSVAALGSWALAASMWTPGFGYAVGLLPALFLVTTLFDDGSWRPQRTVLLAAMGGIALLTLYQSFGSGSVPSALFHNQNSNGAFLSLGAFLVMGVMPSKLTPRHQAVGGFALFALVLAMLAPGSRGVALAFGVGLALYLILAWRTRDWAGWGGVIMPIALAFVADAVLNDDGLAARAGGLLSDSPRTLLWEASLQLLADAPWYGYGAGSFMFFYPRYRLPDEIGSSGFYAHNDYLQLGIELGYPALVLMLVVFAVLTTRIWRAWRSRDERAGSEEYALAAGLAACAVHSLVTFNLYVLPIQVVVALYLARLHRRLYAGATQWRLPPIGRLGQVGALGGALLLAEPFVSLGLAHAMTHGIVYPPLEGTVAEQIRVLNRASALDPDTDTYPMVKAVLLRNAANRLSDAKQAAALRRLALDGFDEALRRNPHRAKNHLERARLLYDMIATDESNRKLARQAAEHALLRNPRQVDARILLAQLMVEAGDRMQALEVLEAGLEYRYRTRAVLPYLEAGLHLAEGLHRKGTVAMFQARIADMESVKTPAAGGHQGGFGHRAFRDK